MITINEGSITIAVNWEFVKLIMLVFGSAVFVMSVVSWVTSMNRLRVRVAELEGEVAGLRRDKNERG